MEVNKDEALRCLDIAKKHFDGGNRVSALKFAKKSIALYPTAEAEKFLLRVEESTAEPSAPPPAYDSGAVPKTSPTNPKVSEHNSGRQTKSYTKEQVEAVKKIKACNPNDFYAILGIDKSATEAQIKKAYRKLALQFHPDKNSAPGADEAFKLISKAFTILSDSDKRREFDHSGCDPDSRSSGSRGFSGHARGYQFEDEINPEQLFNMFFGGFPASTFMGHDGVRYRRQYQRPQHARRGTAADSDSFTYLKLLPFFLLFLFSIISTIFSGTPYPEYSFDMSRHFNYRRETRKHHVEYFVEPREFANTFSNTVYDTKLKKFEEEIENEYYRYLLQVCNQERNKKREAIIRAQGWAPFLTDKVKLKEAENMPMPFCEKAQAFSNGR